MSTGIEVFTTDLSEVDVILLLTNGQTVGFSNPDSAVRYTEILDMEDSGIEVVASFNNASKLSLVTD